MFGADTHIEVCLCRHDMNAGDNSWVKTKQGEANKKCKWKFKKNYAQPIFWSLAPSIKHYSKWWTSKGLPSWIYLQKTFELKDIIFLKALIWK